MKNEKVFELLFNGKAGSGCKSSLEHLIKSCKGIAEVDFSQLIRKVSPKEFVAKDATKNIKQFAVGGENRFKQVLDSPILCRFPTKPNTSVNETINSVASVAKRNPAFSPVVPLFKI